MLQCEQKHKAFNENTGEAALVPEQFKAILHYVTIHF